MSDGDVRNTNNIAHTHTHTAMTGVAVYSCDCHHCVTNRRLTWLIDIVSLSSSSSISPSDGLYNRSNVRALTLLRLPTPWNTGYFTVQLSHKLELKIGDSVQREASRRRKSVLFVLVHGCWIVKPPIIYVAKYSFLHNTSTDLAEN